LIFFSWAKSVIDSTKFCFNWGSFRHAGKIFSALFFRKLLSHNLAAKKRAMRKIS
jgi:hypothetical protein